MKALPGDREVLLLATGNSHKVDELRALLRQAGLDVPVESLADHDRLGSVNEDGKTFAENAAKKALVAGVLAERVALADDSGLEVRALSGLPGVHSSRYAGPGATDEANNIKLLTAMEGIAESERKARFRSVVGIFVPGRDARGAAWALEEYWENVLESGQLRALDGALLKSDEPQRWDNPWGTIVLVSGVCEGIILREPRGDGGFGYDPLFFYPPMEQTFGELPAEVKNEHSHRARAFKKAVEVLVDLF